jgi:hypothetical protein
LKGLVFLHFKSLRSDEELVESKLKIEVRAAPPIKLPSESEYRDAGDRYCPDRDQRSL